MKYAIVGSRSFTDRDLLYKKMDEIADFCDMVVSGGAVGADSLGAQWAKDRNKKLLVFKPNWEAFGKSAGPIRNTQIVENCDTLVAFWDGVSRGTADSIKKAKALKKTVIIVDINHKLEEL